MANTLKGKLAALEAKLANLPGDPADASDIASLISALDTLIDGAITKIDAIQAKTDNLPVSPAATADVANALVDVMNKDINGTFSAATDSLEAISEKIDAGFALTGDAVVANVLDGKFFYKDNYQTKLEGTMPNNAGDVASVSAHMDAGTVLHVVPAEGYTDGVNDASTVDLAVVDTDLVTDNIKAGVTILGVAGKTEVVDTTEVANAAAAGDIALGKVAFVNGVKITGTHE